MSDQPEIFAKTLKSTNLWLKEIGRIIGADKRHSYHVLMAVLHAIRDRLSINQNANFAAQLPLLIRGIYFQNWNPGERGARRSKKQFTAEIAKALESTTPVEAKDACRAVFHVLDHYVSPEELGKVKQSLPRMIRSLWIQPEIEESRLNQTPIRASENEEEIMARYNDRFYRDNDYNRRSMGPVLDEGRFTMRGRGFADDQDYNERDYDDERYFAGGDFDIGNYGYGRDNEERAFHLKRDKDPNRWHGNYSSDRAYENGYYGRNSDASRYRKWGDQD